MYRRFRTPSLWQEMDRLQRQMNEVFGNGSPTRMRGGAGFPALNVWAGPDGLMLTAEVPGARLDDIDISVVGDVLTLTGECNPEQAQEGARYHRQERGYGRFSRTLQLPFRIEADKVEAAFRNGVLTIELPRSEADKPRKIAVKAA